ncbi:hypothetical protein CJ179_00240 [Rhodococcus sp. ACS1]|uniref:hypothetical protein n=1 Tax=Rhodococcus sp. ACS1 TaxID=2028570 RepID=UPI000BB0E707|nr:hypothetical protein [Rhodococcus sp. ACS1]PBC51887.1 hypothetical protein CJ179_00240 [Rhodococcus sp. ACS1]
MNDYNSIATQLEWVCDAVIPADEALGMPAASELRLPSDLLPRALDIRDDQRHRFIEIVSTLPTSKPSDPLGTLSTLPAGDFALLTHLIAGAYYLSADVNAKLGYTGQEAMSYDPDYEEIDEIANRVIARGPVHIDPDTASLATGGKS